MSTAAYRVRRFDHAPLPTAIWSRPPWNGAETLTLDYTMGDKPEHAPKVEARLGYSPESLHAIFRVEDRYVRAAAAEFQGPVWEDSCVEFFFTPGDDPALGYFNLEVNCGGTFLLRHQHIPRQQTFLKAEECTPIQIAHSLPRRIDPELADPVVWTVEYSLPWSLLGPYARVTPPAPGVQWRANFYKCADATTHPHWLTWAKVNRPKPDFHVPECFGVLQFE